MSKKKILVYGSYGYTGKLIVNELKKYNLPVVLSGRNEEKLRAQSKTTHCPYAVLKLEDTSVLIKELVEIKLVIHCAGPFHSTASVMAEACLKTGTHYTDITGEFRVFEDLQKYDDQAKDKGITIMPGVGFDVVPSDCLAAHLKRRLPDATHLELAFTNLRGGFSRGTARTGIDNLGDGSFIREDGSIKNIKAGSQTKEINFGGFKMNATAIPWGDLTTAFQSTGIPNIAVYMGLPEKTLRMIRRSNLFAWLLRKEWVKNWLKKRIDARPEGPSDEVRQGGKSFLWGKAKNEKGEEQISLLNTANGYTLTALTASLIAFKIYNDNFKPGYQTPSMAYGADLILEVSASKRTDV